MATLQTRFDSTGWAQEESRTDHNILMQYVDRLDSNTLVYVRNDCTQAANALPEGHKAGHYIDTAHYCSMRLNGQKLRYKSVD